MNNSESKRFSIALSFPGEYRTFVENIADNLADTVTTERVLYDNYCEAEFARFDLDTYLPNLYRNQSELVVIFLCPEYKEKRWCKLEWRCIRQLIATIDQDRIMLVSFGEPGDMSDIGILPGDGYINIGFRQPDEIATLILQRHAIHAPQTITSAPLSKQIDPATETKREEHFYGKQRGELLDFFVSNWLPNGPAVAILQGFPGCGKTQIARAVAERSPQNSVQVLPQSESPDPSTDLLTDLAVALSDCGIPDMQREMDRGPNGDLFNVLLRILRREKVLIVIDEFQRLFADNKPSPPKRWQQLVEELNNSPAPNGRLLLISNRSIPTARWCENCATRKLDGLTDMEAAACLLELLESANVTAKVPVERVEEVGHRLGGNPRALKTLVGSLRYDSLEDLIPLAPDLFKPGDVGLDPDLVESFERELIERALPAMDGDLLGFMRCLAVHRRPFTKEAFAEFTGTSVPPQTLRKQLIDRFLLESTPGWDCLHPLAREISVTRLRTDKAEWRLAHNFAANYHFRYFKARQPGDTRKLTASYSELRHHLFEADRISELQFASDQLTRFALSQITKPVQSQVPRNVETLEERIALISALPNEKRPKGLEYHLALCLMHRNIGDDYQKALTHARKAVGPQAYYAAWLLLIELEYALNGIGAMQKAQKEALRHLGGGSNSFSVYLRCSKILERDNRLHEAIEVLEKGISTPGVACLSSLISRCAQYLEQAGRIEEAIGILQKGIDTPDIPELATLYLHCAKLMTQLHHSNDAISLLIKGLKIRGMIYLHSMYRTLAELLVKEEKEEEAIRWLKDGITDSRVMDPKELYCLCAKLLVKNHRSDEACSLLEKGIAAKNVLDSVPLYHSYVGLLEETGKREAGVTFLKKAISTPRMSKEPSIYLACAKLLFHAGNLDDAIGILKQGLSIPNLKERGQLYQMVAELTARQGQLDDAIELLKEGIAGKDTHHQFSLYHSCAELMEKAGRLEDAIALMRKSINSPAQTNKTVLYQALAKLLAKAGRTTEAIELLEKAMRLHGMTGLVMLYQTCARLMSNMGRIKDAIKLLNKAIDGPKIGNIISLYALSAELMVDDGQREEAIVMLNILLAEYPGDENLESALKKVIGP